MAAHPVYVDTSWFVALAFDDPRLRSAAFQINRSSALFSSHLLEAELLSAFRREGQKPKPRLLDSIRWIAPNRPLIEEIGNVLEVGYLRGADCWHLACALFLSPDPRQLRFLTLDEKQREVAKDLGFKVGAP